MAPVPPQSQTRYDLVALVASHGLSTVYLTLEVCRSLYRSYRGLGPAQDTRERLAQRSKLLPIFATLAVISFACAANALKDYAILSYRVWASQRDVEVPLRLFGEKGVVSFADNGTAVHVARWLSDTLVHLDAAEILAEKARWFWWRQQIDLGMVSWTMMLSIEGHRRNMPLLWCYQLLAQLVSLSFAQNLFFVALLLTPSPLPHQDDGSLPLSRYVRMRDAIFKPKPTNWTPHPVLYLLTILVSFAAIDAAPYFANTPAMMYVTLTARISTFAPLALPYLVPTSWGAIHAHPHSVYRSYNRLFRAMCVASFVLHAKATAVGVAYNAPDAHVHRHSVHVLFDMEKRSAWERTTSGFGRILGAMSDHPVVSGTGWDVLLSTVSMGVWAAVRAMDVSGILASCIPFYQHSSGADDAVAGSGRSSSTGRRGRPKKTGAAADEAVGDQEYEPTPSEAAATVEGDVLPGAENAEWEQTALIWGLTAVGGLGVGSAGVFGGESTAR